MIELTSLNGDGSVSRGFPADLLGVALLSDSILGINEPQYGALYVDFKREGVMCYLVFNHNGCGEGHINPCHVRVSCLMSDNSPKRLIENF